MKGVYSLSEKKRIVLMPSYMKSFNCIGSACEDSCCIGWRVELDKETYLKYSKIQNKELKPILNKMIKRKHNQKSDDSYGVIKMNEEGKCPFLDEQSLCMIHRNLGPGYLSETCSFYPRNVRKVDGKFERSAAMSCPEVVRLALLNPEGMGFEQVEEDESEKIYINGIFDTEGHLFLNKPERYFWDIRMFSLGLLQNREYTLDERLILLGIFYKKIEALQQNNKIEDIPAVIESMNNSINEKSFKNEMGKIETKTAVQFNFAKKMIYEKAKKGITSERYTECLKETFLGLSYKEPNFNDQIEENSEEVLKKYEENYQKYLMTYLKEKEYIFENFLVNEYFRELMPFGKYRNIWDSYIHLCMMYSIVKFNLTGMSGYHEKITDELTIKLIQSFAKIFTHNTQYIQGMIKAIKDNDFNSLAYMTILVKN